jgi:hypothetical protein
VAGKWVTLVLSALGSGPDCDGQPRPSQQLLGHIARYALYSTAAAAFFSAAVIVAIVTPVRYLRTFGLLLPDG